MNLRAFQGRYAGLVSLGKTVGILLIVINLAAAFVLERYRIARTAIEVERLEREVKQLRKNRAYLESKVSNLESLEHIGSVALQRYSLILPHPDQIVWISDSIPGGESGRSIFVEAIDRLDFLYGSLEIPAFAGSRADAREGAVR